MNKKDTTVKAKKTGKQEEIIIRVSVKENELIRKYAKNQNMNLS